MQLHCFQLTTWIVIFRETEKDEFKFRKLFFRLVMVIKIRKTRSVLVNNNTVCFMTNHNSQSCQAWSVSRIRFLVCSCSMLIDRIISSVYVVHWTLKLRTPSNKTTSSTTLLLAWIFLLFHSAFQLENRVASAKDWSRKGKGNGMEKVSSWNRP